MLVGLFSILMSPKNPIKYVYIHYLVKCFEFGYLCLNDYGSEKKTIMFMEFLISQIKSKFI